METMDSNHNSGSDDGAKMLYADHEPSLSKLICHNCGAAWSGEISYYSSGEAIGAVVMWGGSNPVAPCSGFYDWCIFDGCPCCSTPRYPEIWGGRGFNLQLAISDARRAKRFHEGL